MHPTLPLLLKTDFPPLVRRRLETLQVNLGYTCNQSCLHCHVAASPQRTEQMDGDTVDLVLEVLAARGVQTLDLTGGAPELNVHFLRLVASARALGVRVIDRCNLTILSEPGQEGLAAFLAEQGVEVTASLPCYSAANVDRQRGDGVFERSIAGLQQLNALGYGTEGSGLVLNLVYNPQGPSLPPAQGPLQADYQRELMQHFGIRFNHLFALANMPIQRFGSTLVSKGTFEGYMALLRGAHRDENLETVMCRSLVSVDWQGFLFDCDFNQMLALPARIAGAPGRAHLRELLHTDGSGSAIRVADHCWGCTAGQGSSCGGALEPSTPLAQAALMNTPAEAGRRAGSRTPLWIALAVLALLAVWAWRHFGLGELLTLEQLKASRDALAQAVAQRPLATGAIFFAVYVAAAALSIPGALVLTLAAGAMFGLGWGLLIVSFASSLGALLAFLAARYLLRDSIQSRFGKTLAPINEGVAKDGVFYLLTLRLVPVFPFWLVNLLMGLTPMGWLRFYVVSQLGMLAGTAVFVNAGTQLAAVRSAGDILSPGLWGSFVLLGLFPLLAKAGVGWLQRRKVYARWKKPARFDRNLVVIGAGAGGLVSAYIAAAVKARVTLVEGHKMGGDCLNFGCVPSKALIRSAKLAKQLKKAESLGVADAQGRVDFAAVMQRVHRVIADIEPHDSVERYTGLGVEVLQGHARITSPWTVEVTLANGTKQVLSTKNIVIAAGASPFVPPIPGLKEAGCLTSDTVWGLTSLPRRLVVLGGGPIGSELAQSFARLGSQVTQVEMAPRIMVREDPEVSELVAASLRDDGVTVLTGHQAVRVELVDGERGPEKRLIAKQGEREVAIPFDELLCAVGRSPRVTGYGLEELGIPLTPRRTIETDAYLQTLYPNIFAVGDVAGPYQFTHTAAHQAWYAAVNALFGRFKRFKADYSVIPWATFTDPEVARVGLSESEAREQGVPFEVTRYGLDDLDRAIADGTAHGFVKVLTVPGKDRILGVTIVGEHAGDLLAEYVLAMKHGLGLNKILGTIHTYPTLAEANKYAAGEWKRAHAPKKLLEWVARLHAWERG